MKLLPVVLCLSLFMTGMFNSYIKPTKDPVHESTSNSIQIIVFDKDVHEKKVMDIAHETEESLFPPMNKMIPANFLEMVKDENYKGLGSKINDPKALTFVLCVKNEVAGFINAYTYKEQSVESTCKAMGKSLEEAKEAWPSMVEEWEQLFPKKDSESKRLGHVDSIAVSKKHQGKGYGKKLLRYAIAQLIEKEPIPSINLTVNNDNKIATELYKTEGFVKEDVQLKVYSMMGVSSDIIRIEA